MADSHYSLIIVGGGLSGLAAGIRFARFGESVLILEKHAIPGGLNSYYYRKNFLLETGLHAMTNYAAPKERQAPLNRLFRQLNLSRKQFNTHEQFSSRILFKDQLSLDFSNDISLLRENISAIFPHSIDSFDALLKFVQEYDPFTPREWISTRQTLNDYLKDPVLINMILLPLMVYGNSEEHDMDLGQFVIMFRSIFMEGFFRPDDTIKEFLDLLIDKFKSLGGEIRYKHGVSSFIQDGDAIKGVMLDNNKELYCDAIISTIGSPGTEKLLVGSPQSKHPVGQMSFVESIYILPHECKKTIVNDQTIIFYSLADDFDYCRPKHPIDSQWGVICFPENFKGLPPADHFQIRTTHAANYDLWKNVSRQEYKQMKGKYAQESRGVIEEIIGNFYQNVVYEDSFTPVTIEKFTGKECGAVYGSPLKVKDGRTAFNNLFVAGTDQGYLGIIGSMLSGVTVVNQHILSAG
ncbi:MAG: FAD-dependent oxidoreductase [Desulfobulbaceae bacterium]|uniref:FAD-dependent oxidoreductase n=1 Tax=Candidatus Desulfobia pelagia TaxID=2841692 RepID=A0A8J6NED5_9BACT|nr:FAD-dependent oxidoreductase [Candidatus Desulfobia pelagia]